LASLGHPVVGDGVYGGKSRPPLPFEGLALHAAALSFVHPGTQEVQHFTAAFPARIQRLLCHLGNTPGTEAR
jgi:23S rRNA pseudouridine1911/1915/1917 synthase